MHDFLLAKEIVDEILKISRERKLSKVRKVGLEIGQIALAHDGFDEHVEDISIENLRFGIETVAKGSILEGVEVDIKKVIGNDWKLVDMDGDQDKVSNNAHKA